MDMSPEEFRAAAHEVVNWMADYLAGIRERPVLPSIAPGALSAALPAHGPERGEPLKQILADFDRLIPQATTHWNHPRFFAYFAVSASGPGILGEMLSAALNVNGMLWKSGPACTELEQVTLGWLREWIGLPPEFFGILYDTASISTMHGIAAAREMVDPEARNRGARGDLTLYTSAQSHSSVDKGAIAIGVGRENIRHVPVNERFEMNATALRAMIKADKGAGRKPFCVVATVGTTSTTSVDPVAEIADIAEEHGLWLHVDAAYAGVAAMMPELHDLLRPAARAQSLVTNPHKWMMTPIDCSAFYTRRPDILRRAFSLVPEYLETAEQALNPMDYGVQLGRRFRAIKLWFVMRYFGREGLAATMREHIGIARRFEELVRGDDRFELMAPRPFSVVCFRYKGTEEENRLLVDEINARAKAFLSHTVLNGVLVLRLAIGHARTTWDDVQPVWDAMQAFARGRGAAA